MHSIISIWNSKLWKSKPLKCYNMSRQKLTRGANIFPTFSKIFPKIDFWATTWSEDAKDIFLESLENFGNITRQLFFKIFILGTFTGNFKIVPNFKKSSFWGWKGQKSRMTQKIDFPKVRDIDTPIQTRKKKHETNVSSDLITF